MLKLVVFALCCVAIFVTGTPFLAALIKLIRVWRKR